jgi:hypothetical protein
MRKHFVELAAAAVLAGCSGIGPATDDLAGTYETRLMLEDGDWTLAGTWRIELLPAPETRGTEERRYEGRVWRDNALYVERSQITATATQLTFGKEGGAHSCTDLGYGSGVYEWKLRTNELTLTPISDPCAHRRQVVSTHALQKIQ